jgi:membrane protein DedA with SNARE-associated domain
MEHGPSRVGGRGPDGDPVGLWIAGLASLRGMVPVDIVWACGTWGCPGGDSMDHGLGRSEGWGSGAAHRVQA